NGGDGFVAARKLQEWGRKVQLVLLAEPGELKGDAATMFEKMPLRPIIAQTEEDLFSETAQAAFRANVLVDAILGTGFKPPVHGLYAQAIAVINACDVPVITVDIPSGADSDVMGEQTGAVSRADAIVTFTAPRPAHVFGLLTRGPIIVAPIGSPDEAI